MKEISFSSFYQAYQKENLHVLDIREQEEYDAFHLEGVQLFPLSELADRYQELKLDQLYYAICKSGIHSARACQFLEKHGYKVINVQGGMTAFENL
ncbi:rhodanese-like domain-containing protein [Streptococcus oralis]|uniref:Rhodanese-like domain protein n=1 Tax=Streptococcus oralis TaxID=1303 RepID=A0A139PD40_STROR|nr:rhodanese-like domain-containing protein [Streptococcus oralis]KXT85806.1 Rhodanese-like domain protein [Streptococcus oralis]